MSIIDTTIVTDASARGERASFAKRFFRDPAVWISLVWIALIVVSSVGADALAPFPPNQQDLARAFEGPSADHWLGTDSVGRDVLSRLMAGGGIALLGVLQAVVVAMLIGVPLGLIAGYRGGWVDNLINRIADFLFALPGIVLLLAVVAIFGTQTWIAMVTLGVLFSASFIRLVRASTASARRELYVDAATVSGLPGWRILGRHIFPNVFAPLVIQSTLALGTALEIQAGLGFLGLSAPPPQANWGGMVAEASRYIIKQPWLMVPTGLVLIFTVLAFNMLGDAIRDASMPKPVGARRYPFSAVNGVRSLLGQRRAAAPVEAGEDGVDKRTHADAGHVSCDPEALLDVRGLSIQVIAQGRQLVHDVSFSLRPGTTLGLVGESGSGKTMTALSVLGLLPQGVATSAGTVEFDGVDLLSLDQRALRRYRGSQIGMISQEPMVALDPAFTVRSQLLEPLRRLKGMKGAAATARAAELLSLVGIQRVDEVLRSYPHQLSGGMAQRVAIAIALTGEPRLLIADEPTTALDVSVQAEILDLLRSLQRKLGMGMLLVTHDFGVVADICDDIVVMRDGEIVEHQASRELFADPRHEYTRALLDASPEHWDFPASETLVRDAEPLLAVNDLHVEFPVKGWGKKPFHALRGISLEVRPGETVGLVGESGSGKTTLGRAVLGLAPVRSGSIRFDGEELVHASTARRREVSKSLQVVFQDPYSSLNPMMTVSDILTEPLVAHGHASRADAEKRVVDLLDLVQLPADAANRTPSEFSGGQRQRIAIARALVMRPKLIVCDEALSALDLSTQEKVVLLLREIQRETGVAYLFIAHDLAVVRGVSDRVVVMYHGEIVEEGDAEVIGERPTQPYTKRLLLSAPVPDPVRQAERREERRLELAAAGSAGSAAVESEPGTVS